MSEYHVRIPIAGVLSMVVDAESEEEAIEKALSTDVFIDLTEGDGTSHSPEVEEWDMYRSTVQGNVNYTPLWHAKAEEI